MGERHLIYDSPIARSGEVAVPYTPSWFLPYSFEFVIDRDRPQLALAVVDCTGVGALGVRPSLPDGPNVTPFYLYDAYPFLRSGSGTRTLGLAVMPNLPDAAAQKKLTVRAERSDGERINQRDVWLRPGWVTSLRLTPAARFEL